MCVDYFFFFFFQAEDGIRDHCVTGVQTCALPIYRLDDLAIENQAGPVDQALFALRQGAAGLAISKFADAERNSVSRSEERRVGKECRCRGWRYHENKKWMRVRKK